MKLISILFLVWAYFALTCQPVAGKRRYFSVEATGRVLCYGQAVQNVEIRLMDRDLGIDQKMGHTRTNSQGYFRVKGRGRDIFNGKPDPYIQVVYQYSGSYGSMRVENFLGLTRKHKTKKRRYASYLNFGTLSINNIHCKSFVQFYKALKDFYLRTGHRPPYRVLKVRSAALIHGGTPYATTNVIRIPRKTRDLSLETAKHELAHTIRHSYDGTFGHFLIDVARYKYMQHHSCGKKTNAGFAFNEGWAEFWAGSCKAASYGGSATNYNYEGNVANALRKLQKDCGTSDANMVKVLKRAGRRKIHSFNEYKKKHASIIGC